LKNSLAILNAVNQMISVTYGSAATSFLGI
jgi:hypothetical protein